jgi:type VI secretion system protein ImpH
MIERLQEGPRRFGFFQAVRLLERERRRRARAETEGDVPRGPDQEIEAASYRAEASLAFPATEVAEVRPVQSNQGQSRYLAEMVVSFFGLTGPSGVLPQHYSALIIAMRSRNRAFRDFLDLFNHRLITLFVDAWAKYRLPIAFERRQVGADDPITAALRGIVGFPVDPWGGARPKTDSWVLYYAGLFAHTVRSPAGLEGMLGDYFRLPIAVVQFVGRWLTLGAADWTALPDGHRINGSYCALGENATLGDRVWDVQGCFRLVLGPLDYPDFLRFMPGSDDYRMLLELARLYVGQSLDFDVQLVLRRDQVPASQLAETESYTPHLGWNTWLPNPERWDDAADAVFGGKLVALDGRAMAEL